MLKSSVLGLVVGFVMLALTVAPVLAQETYTAPVGEFTTEIPTGWNNESTADYGLFTNGDTSAFLLTIESTDAQTGIEAAIHNVLPDFASVKVASNDLPAPNGLWTQNVYAEASGTLQVALAQVSDGKTYVILFLFPSQQTLVAQQVDVNSILLSAVVGTPIDLTDQQPATLDDAALADISDYVNTAMVDYGIVGAAVAIVQDGEVIYADGFGTLSQEDETPVNAETLFMIGSTTKSMTTLMTATLVDDGIVTWDTPVTDILPDFTLSDSTATAEIQLRDLFNMSSGIPRFDIPISLEVLTPALVEQEIADIPLASPPGQAYHYSNFMVALGGFADAVAAGADLSNAASAYGNLMQTRVFDPIGMDSTTFSFDSALSNPNHALPYSEDPMAKAIVLVPISVEQALTGVAPAGAVWSNADDMGRYMITQMQQGVTPDGERIVSEKNLLETWTPEISIAGDVSYGMGWMIDSYNGQRLINHGGNTAGFTTDFAFLPDADLGVLVLSNVGLANNFAESVREYTFETAFGLEHTSGDFYAAAEDSLNTIMNQLIAQTGYREQTVDPEAVADYLGSYERGIEIMIDDGHLVVSTPYLDILLLPTNDANRFVSAGVMAGTSITFNEDDGGNVSATIDSLLGPITGEPQSLTLAKIE